MGTLFPDIRYVAHFPRELTHPIVRDVGEVESCFSKFEAGIKFHLALAITTAIALPTPFLINHTRLPTFRANVADLVDIDHRSRFFWLSVAVAVADRHPCGCAASQITPNGTWTGAGCRSFGGVLDLPFA